MQEKCKSARNRGAPASLQSSDVLLKLPVLAAAAAAQCQACRAGHGLEGIHHRPELPLRRLHKEAESGAAVSARDCGRLQGKPKPQVWHSSKIADAGCRWHAPAYWSHGGGVWPGAVITWRITTSSAASRVCRSCISIRVRGTDCKQTLKHQISEPGAAKVALHTVHKASAIEECQDNNAATT